MTTNIDMLLMGRDRVRLAGLGNGRMGAENEKAQESGLSSKPIHGPPQPQRGTHRRRSAQHQDQRRSSSLAMLRPLRLIVGPHYTSAPTTAQTRGGGRGD